MPAFGIGWLYPVCPTGNASSGRVPLKTVKHPPHLYHRKSVSLESYPRNMLLYALTISLSAFLLFEVQPVIAKMILPWFGGSSAVWSTCPRVPRSAQLSLLRSAVEARRSREPRRGRCCRASSSPDGLHIR